MNEDNQTLQLFNIFERQPLRDTLLQSIELSMLVLLQSKSDGTYTIALELAVSIDGKKRQILVHPYRFLEAVIYRQTVKLSRSLVYDPVKHRLNPLALQICRLLWQAFADYPSHEGAKQALIPISASLWQRLEPLLRQHPYVQLQYYIDDLPLDEQLQEYAQLSYAEHKLPISLQLYSMDGSCVMNGEQLQTLVLLPTYELACYEGRFYRFTWEQAEQLHGLYKLMREAHWQLTLEQSAMSQFIDHVIPQLQRMLNIHIADNISSKLTTIPLQPNVFLDRVRERLLIGVEFQYGSLVIQPFQPTQIAAADERIVLREREKEAEILELVLKVEGIQTEGGIIVEGDEAEYEFFRNILPQLKLLANIHATTAVKLRYVNDQVYPQLNLTWEEKSNWLHYSFSMAGISDQELKELLQAVVEKRKYYRLSQGALLSLEHPQYAALMRVMSELGLLHPSAFDDAIPLARAIPTILTLQKQDQSISLSRSLKRFIESLRQPHQQEIALPQCIQASPRDYQLDGFQWLSKLARYQLGGILADEMGLGKTLQAIMLLASQQEALLATEQQNGITAQAQKQLIITPASLLYNWQQELARFAPLLSVHVLDGNDLQTREHGEHQDINRQALQQFPLSWQQADIWIASYQFVRSQQQLLQSHTFLTIVCDEAQAFKNDYTKTSRALRQLQSSHRFALTGTPIENRLDELWSIMSLVNPALFPDKNKWLDMPREKLKAMIAPFMLRRTKQEVMQELPPKYESTLYAPLTMEQKQLYLAQLAKLQEDTLKHLDCKKKGERRIKILAGITRLRQICCHPELFVDGYKGESAKLQQLLQLVDEKIAAGNRILIFSQFTSMLQIIARELQWNGYSHYYLDGSTPPKQRIELVDQFNQGSKQIFLMSLKAGGTGLNVTGADTVILYDLWWNPAVEQQAADRVHRIGQQLPVHIIRLVAEGTLEDRMIQLQHRKQQLISDILDEQQLTETTLSEDDLLMLLQHQLDGDTAESSGPQ